jgi:hypothetical protein
MMLKWAVFVSARTIEYLSMQLLRAAASRPANTTSNVFAHLGHCWRWTAAPCGRASASGRLRRMHPSNDSRATDPKIAAIEMQCTARNSVSFSSEDSGEGDSCRDTWVVLEGAAEHAVGVGTALVNEAVDDAIEARLQGQSRATVVRMVWDRQAEAQHSWAALICHSHIRAHVPLSSDRASPRPHAPQARCPAQMHPSWASFADALVISVAVSSS